MEPGLQGECSWGSRGDMDVVFCGRWGDRSVWQEGQKPGRQTGPQAEAESWEMYLELEVTLSRRRILRG